MVRATPFLREALAGGAFSAAELLTGDFLPSARALTWVRDRASAAEAPRRSTGPLAWPESWLRRSVSRPLTPGWGLAVISGGLEEPAARAPFLFQEIAERVVSGGRWVGLTRTFPHPALELVRSCFADAGLSDRLVSVEPWSESRFAELLAKNPSRLTIHADTAHPDLTLTLPAATRGVPVSFTPFARLHVVVLPEHAAARCAALLAWTLTRLRAQIPMTIGEICLPENGADDVIEETLARLRAFPRSSGGSGSALDAAATSRLRDGPVFRYRGLADALERLRGGGAGTAPDHPVLMVLGRDHAQAEAFGRQTPARTVIVNDAPRPELFTGYAAPLPERQLVVRPRSRLWALRTWRLLPETPLQEATLRWELELFRKHWLDRLRAYALLLWHVALLRKEEHRP